ncbi:MAG: hypothetical protein Ta2A_16930 [Treponemataceae bacterium]|nr:MAG: hypothetical protein Ta2A_16930 [Treponemataceae bacterium]
MKKLLPIVFFASIAVNLSAFSIFESIPPKAKQYQQTEIEGSGLSNTQFQIKGITFEVGKGEAQADFDKLKAKAADLTDCRSLALHESSKFRIVVLSVDVHYKISLFYVRGNGTDKQPALKKIEVNLTEQQVASLEVKVPNFDGERHGDRFRFVSDELAFESRWYPNEISKDRKDVEIFFDMIHLW